MNNKTKKMAKKLLLTAKELLAEDKIDKQHILEVMEKAIKSWGDAYKIKKIKNGYSYYVKEWGVPIEFEMVLNRNKVTIITKQKRNEWTVDKFLQIFDKK